MEKADCSWLRHLRDASVWIQRIAGHCGIEKIKSSRKCDPAWLLEQICGVFIVRLSGTNGIDHCIIADCSRKEIIDSCETYPMTLSIHSLEACIGDGSSFKGIKEIRKLVLYKSPTQKFKKIRIVQRYEMITPPVQNKHRSPNRHMELRRNI